MTSKTARILSNCLYFTANRLARATEDLADEEFAVIGLAPSHALLLMIICEEPGISPTDAAVRLDMAPSTMTRFVDALVRHKLVITSKEGRRVFLEPSARGQALYPKATAAWASLYKRLSQALGKEAGDSLTVLATGAADKLRAAKK